MTGLQCPVCSELTDALIESDRAPLCCPECFEKAIDHGRQKAFLIGLIYGVFIAFMAWMTSMVVVR